MSKPLDWDEIERVAPDFVALVDAFTDAKFRPTVEYVAVRRENGEVAQLGERLGDRMRRLNQWGEKWHKNLPGFGKTPDQIAAEMAYEAEKRAIAEQSARASKALAKARQRSKAAQRIKK